MPVDPATGCSERSIAYEHLDRHLAPLHRAHEPEHDLQLVPLAIAVVAAFGQRAGAALEIGRGDVVEDQRAVLEVAPRQRPLDALLARISHTTDGLRKVPAACGAC
jgi:hypothetical protein